MRHIPKIRRRLLALILGAALAAPSWAQFSNIADDEDPGPETQANESSTDEESTDEESTDEESTEEIEVDEGSYIDAEDDDFRPSEEIPADQSIPFPTDI